MTEHTRGPWKNEGVYIQDSDGHFVAETDTARDDDINFSNARLIAAAPDLLEIAMEVNAHFDGTDSPLRLRALAAVEKALG